MEQTVAGLARYRPRFGHAGRLRMSRREIALVIGHLLLIAVALEDEDITASIGAMTAWTEPTMALVGAGLRIGVLVAWGALTLAWVQCRSVGRP